MNLASDNTGPVHPHIMDALATANRDYALPYGNDLITATAIEAVRQTFEAPEAAVYFVATGSAANALLLATMCQPWQTIFCAPQAHIAVDECGAPEFFTGGSKLTLVGDLEDKIEPAALAKTLADMPTGDVHSVQSGPVSLTQATERGRVYALNELSELTRIAHDAGCKVHLDGARFANAAAALGCSAAEMSWKAGVDAVSFGGTKNGCMGVEAAIIFDPDLAWEFELRRKRAGHLFSKTRYLAAQMAAYLDGDLWLEMARAANAQGAHLDRALRQIPGVEMLFERDVNMLYPAFPRRAHQRLAEAGAAYTRHGPLEGDPDELISCRLVCDWSIDSRDLDRFAALVAG